MRKKGRVTSKYRGVFHHHHKGYAYWKYSLRHENKVYVKTCVSEEHAAKGYNKKCLELGLFEKMYEL